MSGRRRGSGRTTIRTGGGRGTELWSSSREVTAVLASGSSRAAGHYLHTLLDPPTGHLSAFHRDVKEFDSWYAQKSGTFPHGTISYRFAWNSDPLHSLHSKGFQEVVWSILSPLCKTPRYWKTASLPFLKNSQVGKMPESLQISLKILWSQSKKGLLHGFS